MKARAIIAHCWTGAPGDGWYPSAVSALAEHGIAAHVPALPDSLHPDRQAWQAALSGAIGTPEESLLLIGHSLGAIALLHWLTRAAAGYQIDSLLLIAPPLSPTGVAEVDRFLDPPPDLREARRRVRRIDAILGANDPWLRPDPMSLSRRLQSELGAQVRVLPDRGHFVPASGQTPLPELHEWTLARTRFLSETLLQD
ncbi:RBBP9/YdeN family alpha/beta hydrolase [Arenimonas sp.]|uniref:RBBP9/YdeN family alpha/beta hydrolase n=1 Tax=Arenimonas sp. TaxID=1872635 RepID=UPI0039E6CD57